MRKFESLQEEILHRVKKGYKKQVTWRRRLHQYPELSFEEYKTTAFLKNEIKKLGFKILPIKLPTGLIAEISGCRPGATVAIRTDIDALPVLEKTGLPFKSRTVGRMHACGHDMHMAAVLGTGAVIAAMKDKFPGHVRLLFQPAEEMPPGGAKPMIDEGALKDVSMVLGLHVDPEIPTGEISLRDGITMASVYDFDIIVTGQGGHAARPHQVVDALATAAEILESLQKIVSREIDPIAPVAISFGKITGGTARNTIAEEVRIWGTARTLSAENFKKVPTLIKRTVRGICLARGAVGRVEPIASFPPLKNSPVVNKLLAKNYRRLFPDNKISETEMVLGGEDFAYYLKKVPGAMFRLGIRNDRLGANRPWHSPNFIADENALIYATSLLTAATMDFLNQQKK
ncbi:MAG: M20 metallopeptidase family protein [Candidatus Zixiibacteriota bacterium]